MTSPGSSSAKFFQAVGHMDLTMELLLARRDAWILWSDITIGFKALRSEFAGRLDFSTDDIDDLGQLQEVIGRLRKRIRSVKRQREAELDALIASIEGPVRGQAAKRARVDDSNRPSSSVPHPASAPADSPKQAAPAASSLPSAQKQRQAGVPVNASKPASSTTTDAMQAAPANPAANETVPVPARANTSAGTSSSATDRARAHPSVPKHALLRGLAVAGAVNPQSRALPAVSVQPVATATTQPVLQPGLQPGSQPVVQSVSQQPAAQPAQIPVPPRDSQPGPPPVTTQNVAAAAAVSNGNGKRPLADTAAPTQKLRSQFLEDFDAESGSDPDEGRGSGSGASITSSSDDDVDDHRPPQQALPSSGQKDAETVAIEEMLYQAGVAVRAHPTLISALSFGQNPHLEFLAEEEPTLIEPYFASLPAGHAWARSFQDTEEALSRRDATLHAKLRHIFATTVLRRQGEPITSARRWTVGMDKFRNPARVDARILAEYHKCCVNFTEWTPRCKEIGWWAGFKNVSVVKRLEDLLMEIASRVPKPPLDAPEPPRMLRETKVRVVKPVEVEKGENVPFTPAEEEHLLLAHQIATAKNLHWHVPRSRIHSNCEQVARKMNRSARSIVKRLRELVAAAVVEVERARLEPRVSEAYTAAEELLILDAHQKWLTEGGNEPRYQAVAKQLGRTLRNVKQKASELRKRKAFTSAKDAAAARKAAKESSSSSATAAPVPTRKQEQEEEGRDDSDAGRPPLEAGGDAAERVSSTSAGSRVGASARYDRGAAGMSEYDEDDDESLQSDDEY